MFAVPATHDRPDVSCNAQIAGGAEHATDSEVVVGEMLDHITA